MPDKDLPKAIAEAILASPDDILDSLVGALIGGRLGPASTRGRIEDIAPQAASARAIEQMLRLSSGATGESLALAVASAASTRARMDESGARIQIVWTGPEEERNPTRRTDQVILEMIRAAKHRLLVVSYAVYDVSEIIEALIDALKRGVEVTVVLDLSGEAEGTWNNRDALKWPKDAPIPNFLHWPETNVKPVDRRKPPKLHAKCVVADGRELLVTSANLTSHAMERNMELGVRVSGGRAAEEVERHFANLIDCGILTPLP